jgi:CoA:oxalate CoA-transferase
LDISEIATDPRFEILGDRLKHYDALKQIITPKLLVLSRAEVIEKMSKEGIPVGPVNSMAEILEDPQIRAREMIQELTHPDYGPIPQLGIPIKLSDTPGVVQGAPPRFGEHNRDVLSMLGYSNEEIERYERDGILLSG